ncbi:MAG: PHP domain-containing protein [bacterium]|nr:PHP domain-containing protein [bacterium]
MRDFHIHTCYSDGTCSPLEMADKLAEAGVKKAAITDHDSADAFYEKEFLSEAKKTGTGRFAYKGMEIHTGAEIDCMFNTEKYPQRKEPIEILAYGFDENSKELKEYLERIQAERRERIFRLAEAANTHFGKEIISKDEILGIKAKTLMKPHVVNRLLEKGLISEYREGNKILKDFEKENPASLNRISPFDAIKLIHNAGGKAFLAHPLVYTYDSYDLGEVTAIINDLLNKSLDGIELYYPYAFGHRPKYTPEEASDMAKKLKRLFPDAEYSQGSDSHSVQDIEALHSAKELWAKLK